MLTVFEKIEMPLIPVLIDMEYAGIAVDAKFFTEYSQELSRRLLELQKKIYKQVGYAFNINSTQQLSKALFETLHLTLAGFGQQDQKRDSYPPRTGVLDEMEGDQHVVVKLLLE